MRQYKKPYARAISNHIERHPYFEEYNKDRHQCKMPNAVIETVPNSSRSWQLSRGTFKSNEAHYRLCRVLKDRYNISLNTYHAGKTILLECGTRVEANYFACMQINGSVSITINPNTQATAQLFRNSTGNTEQRFLTTDLLYTEDGVQDFCRRTIEKMLYPFGKFRNFQLQTGLSKQQLKDLYRGSFKKFYSKETTEDETIETVKAIERKYNCTIGWEITPEEFIDFCRACLKSKFEKKTQIDKFNYLALFHHATDHDGDIDEIESQVHEYFDDLNPDAVYINCYTTHPNINFKNTLK